MAVSLRVRLVVTSAVLGAIAFALPSVASANSQTFTPVADSYVSSTDPTANYGAATRLRVQGDPTTRSYLRFEVDAPPGTRITGATLRLYTGSGSTLVGYQAYGVASTSWDEARITDENAPGFGPRLGTSGGWSTPGYKDVPLPSDYVHPGLNSVGAGTSAASEKSFYSREAGASPPQLVVDYAPSQYPIRGLYGRDSSATGFDNEAAIGFNLMDSGAYKDQMDALAARGLRGMVWLGGYSNTTCRFNQSDDWVRSHVSAIAGNPGVGVYFVDDEPDANKCPTAPTQIKARSDLVHSVDPGSTTLLVGYRQFAQFAGTTDVMGLDHYPCTLAHGCYYSRIDQQAAEADQLGIRYFGVVQAFGDSFYKLPTADELHEEFLHWRATHMEGYLVFAWNWPSWDSSLWLANHPELQSQLAEENGVAP